MLTLYQATIVAKEKYDKSPTMTTLKSAINRGKLKAEKLPISPSPNKYVWLVSEEDLAMYLVDWRPGQGAPVGNKRRVGKTHSAESKAKIAKTERERRDRQKKREETPDDGK